MLLVLMMMVMMRWWMMHFGAEADYSADVFEVDQGRHYKGEPCVCWRGCRFAKPPPRVVSASAEASF